MRSAEFVDTLHAKPSPHQLPIKRREGCGIAAGDGGFGEDAGEDLRPPLPNEAVAADYRWPANRYLSSMPWSRIAFTISSNRLARGAVRYQCTFSR